MRYYLTPEAVDMLADLTESGAYLEGGSLWDVYDAEDREAVKELDDHGLLNVDGTSYTLTTAGRELACTLFL